MDFGEFERLGDFNRVACIHTYYLHIYTRMYIHNCIYIYIYLQIHTYARTHTHTHTVNSVRTRDVTTISCQQGASNECSGITTHNGKYNFKKEHHQFGRNIHWQCAAVRQARFCGADCLERDFSFTEMCRQDLCLVSSPSTHSLCAVQTRRTDGQTGGSDSAFTVFLQHFEKPWQVQRLLYWRYLSLSAAILWRAA
jgi:hypothetical protein